MKRIAFAFVAALALAGCGAGTLGNLPSTPATVANGTVLDERGAIAVETAYKGFRVVLETLVDSGLLYGDRAAQAAEWDNRAYAAVQVARSAYRAGNANDYADALDEARKAIAGALAAL